MVELESKVFNDNLTDGLEVGFFNNSPGKILFRTNVRDGAISYDNYVRNNIFEQWIWYPGNGTGAGNYSYNSTIYEPTKDYSDMCDGGGFRF